VYDEADKINHVTVATRLNEKGKLAECGGIPSVIEISLATTSAEIAQSALDRMLDSYCARQAANIGKQLAAGDLTPEEAQEQLSKLNRHTREGDKNWIDALNESVVTSRELHGLALTPRRKLLGDWFCEGDLGFIFAFRGVGKTWLALAIAEALSTGGKLGDWKAHEPVKVLYIDSEMPADLMRDRCDGLGGENNE
jgi:replicative DNA helicase